MPINGNVPMQYPFPYKTDDGNDQTSGGGGGSGVSSFTGDGQVLNNSGSTGAVTATLATHNKNLVLASDPTNDGATPTFRALVAADLPTSSSTFDNITLTDAADQVRFSNSAGVGEFKANASAPNFNFTNSSGLTTLSTLNAGAANMSTNLNTTYVGVGATNLSSGTSGSALLEAISDSNTIEIGMVNPGNVTSTSGDPTTLGAGVIRTVSDVDGMDIVSYGSNKKIRLGFDTGTEADYNISLLQGTGISIKNTLTTDFTIMKSNSIEIVPLDILKPDLGKWSSSISVEVDAPLISNFQINGTSGLVFPDLGGIQTDYITYPPPRATYNVDTGNIYLADADTPVGDSTLQVVLPDISDATVVPYGLTYTFTNVSSMSTNVGNFYNHDLTFLLGPLHPGQVCQFVNIHGRWYGNVVFGVPTTPASTYVTLQNTTAPYATFDLKDFGLSGNAYSTFFFYISPSAIENGAADWKITNTVNIRDCAYCTVITGDGYDAADNGIDFGNESSSSHISLNASGYANFQYLAAVGAWVLLDASSYINPAIATLTCLLQIGSQAATGGYSFGGLGKTGDGFVEDAAVGFGHTENAGAGNTATTIQPSSSSDPVTLNSNSNQRTVVWNNPLNYSQQYATSAAPGSVFDSPDVTIWTNPAYIGP